VNQATQEWTDGLVPTLVRLSVNDETDNKNWVTFDGPVDALWIENMNTVLDDNKMLCLSNGERIKLSASMHMVFEVNDLSVASPATVSRCGMVFMEAVYIGQAPHITSWTQHKLVKTLPQHVQRFDKLLNKYAVPAIEFFLEECREGLTQGIAAHYLRNMFNIMDSVLLPEHGVSAGKGGVEGMINQWFIFAFIWAIGGNSHDDSRTKFDAYVRDCGILKELDPTFPKEGLVFDYCVSAEQQSFVPWSSLMPSFAYVPGMPYFNILVPTGETTCYDFLLKVLIANGTHILTCGETGSGKSVLVQGFLTRMNPDTSNSIQAAFSAQTAAKNMRDILESKLDKLRKNLLGAPPGRQTVIFVDDINMPALETYGAQPPIELVRQVLSQGGFYDLKKLFFKAVQNTAFIAACGPPGGGRNALTPRLVRHFNLLWIPQLSKEGMQRIFINILSGFFSASGFAAEVKELAEPSIKATVNIYNLMLDQMLPTPSKSHYTFNLRDVSRVCQGILQMTPAKCEDAESYLRLWAHETCRVFHDRLINNEDKATFCGWIIDELKSDNLGNRDWEASTLKTIVYGGYMNTTSGVTGQIYKQEDVVASADKFAEYLNDYNAASTKPMNLVFFTDACLHLARLSRIIAQPRGCALLVGVGGSGRSSQVRMAAAMWEMKCMSIEITRTYDNNSWRDDLKSFMFEAGCENRPTIFLFSDTQIIKESMLEDVNNILNAGEVLASTQHTARTMQHAVSSPHTQLPVPLHAS
jgi:dynein heavy chain